MFFVKRDEVRASRFCGEKLASLRPIKEVVKSCSKINRVVHGSVFMILDAIYGLVFNLLNIPSIYLLLVLLLAPCMRVRVSLFFVCSFCHPLFLLVFSQKTSENNSFPTFFVWGERLKRLFIPVFCCRPLFLLVVLGSAISIFP